MIRFSLLLMIVTGFWGTFHAAEHGSLSLSSSANSVRHRESVNDGWKFLAKDASGAEQAGFNDGAWQQVDLPHTWNAEDTLDDTPGYRMGVGWYRRVIAIERQLRGKRLFLYFEGANQVADVFVNGKLAGSHKGGYTAFVFDITSLVTFDSPDNRNLIAVKVDNQINDDIPPSAAADFNLYGGIYRDVWLMATEPVHFAMLDHAGPGVYSDTPSVSAESAVVRVRGTVTNDSDKARSLRVSHKVIDSFGQTVSVAESTISVAARGSVTFERLTPPVSAPRLWSPETPYLYMLQTQLREDENVLDELTSPLGFRWFSFDPAQGFFLNGNRYKLRGTNRHQDYAGLGNALPDKIHVQDLERIKELGLNCVLLAHYPQDPVVLETADRLGLIIWEELPVVREISVSKAFADNCQLMLTEMIRQHYNHPSIIMWCLMNEIFLKMRYEPGYVRQVVSLARTLDQLARSQDPTRVTVISANRPYDNTDIYNASGLLNVSQVVGWHMYFGWYYGEFEGLGKFLDDEHRRFPKRVLFVSEYGADSDPRVHAQGPARGDGSSEWARLYHESYLAQFEGRAYLGGTAVWAQHDFGSEARGESRPHLNTKGLATFDRKPKDVYYLYAARFSSSPVLRIATHDWLSRTGTDTANSQPESKRAVTQLIEVYSNLKAVELFVNRKSLGVKDVGPTKKLVWDVSFEDGLNVLEARARSGNQELTDRAEVRFSYRPAILADASVPFRELAVNVGAAARYVDAAGRVWEPDQQYMPGKWGCTGGAPASTRKDVLGTADDPLFQSSRQGVTSCRFDVPDGSYELELLFAEHSAERAGQRVFSVALNGKPLIANLDLFKDPGVLRAETRVFRVNATGHQGLMIDFAASAGEAVLNAVRIRKLK